jgi:hypothetical protein
MKLQSPPYGEITASSSEEASRKLDGPEQAAFAAMWPQAWPAYREVLEELFSEYDHDNLFEKNQTRVLLEKLAPNKKANDRADLLLRFSFDETGITWDIFQRGRTIVHAQPAF